MPADKRSEIGPRLWPRYWVEFLEAQPELRRIVIEVTGNRAIAEYARMRRVIEDIRERGGSCWYRW